MLTDVFANRIDVHALGSPSTCRDRIDQHTSPWVTTAIVSSPRPLAATTRFHARSTRAWNAAQLSPSGGT